MVSNMLEHKGPHGGFVIIVVMCRIKQHLRFDRTRDRGATQGCKMSYGVFTLLFVATQQGTKLQRGGGEAMSHLPNITGLN